MDKTSGEGKGKMTPLMQDYMVVFNALGLCKFFFFARVSHDTLCRWIKGLTGWEMTSEVLMELEDRLDNLKRGNNVMMGISSEKDIVAPRILELLRPGKPIPEGEKLFFDMRKEYYEFRGWDEKEIPTREKLFSLGLEEAVWKMERSR